MLAIENDVIGVANLTSSAEAVEDVAETGVLFADVTEVTKGIGDCMLSNESDATAAPPCFAVAVAA